MSLYDTRIASLNPVGQWPLSEPSGTVANDLSGNGNHGTYGNSPVLGQPALINSVDPDDASADFESNSSEYVALGVGALNGLISGKSQVTVEAWVSLESDTGGSQYLITSLIRSTGSSGFGFRFRPGSVLQVVGRSQSDDAFQTLASTFSFAGTGAHHVVGVLDYTAKTMALYLDGQLHVSSSSVPFGSNTYIPGVPTVGDAVVSRSNGDHAYDGRASKIAIYDYALPPADILQNFQTGQGPLNQKDEALDETFVVASSGATSLRTNQLLADVISFDPVAFDNTDVAVFDRFVLTPQPRFGLAIQAADAFAVVSGVEDSLAPPSSSYDDLVVALGADGFWPLYDAAGPVLDLSGNGADGTVEGGVVFGAPGNLWDGETAVTLDGVDSSIDIGAQLNSRIAVIGDGDFTLGAWVRSTGTTGNNLEIMTWTSGGSVDRFFFRFSTTGFLSFAMAAKGASTSTIFSNNAFANDGVWHFVVARRQSNQLRLFVDAVRQNNTFTGAKTFTTDDGQVLHIGRQENAGFPGFFVGDIHKAFFDTTRAWSDAELLGSYKAGFSEYVSLEMRRAVSYYLLDELVGSGTFDHAGGTTDEGTNAGGVSFRVPGPVVLNSGDNFAYRFDGIDDGITVPDTPAHNFGSSQNLSISAWLNTSTGNNVHWLNKVAAGVGYNAQVLGAVGGLVRFELLSSVASVTVDSAVAVNDGQWHYIVLTVDRAGFARIYINGVPSGVPVDVTSLGDLTSAADLNIGFDGSGAHYSGDMAHVVLAPAAYTTAEVQARLLAAIPPPPVLAIEAIVLDTVSIVSVPGANLAASEILVELFNFLDASTGLEAAIFEAVAFTTSFGFNESLQVGDTFALVITDALAGLRQSEMLVSDLLMGDSPAPLFSLLALEQFVLSESARIFAPYNDQVDEVFSLDSPVIVLYARFLVESLYVSDSLDVEWILNVVEAINLDFQVRSQAEQTLAVSDLFSVFDRLRLTWALAAADALSLVDGTELNLGKAVVLIDVLRFISPVDSQLTANSILAEAVSLLASTVRAFEGVGSETVTLTSAAEQLNRAAGGLLDDVLVEDTLDQGLRLSLIGAADFNLDANPESVGVFQTQVTDSFLALTTFRIDGELYTGWVMNAETGGMSQYTDFNFNSMTRYRQRYLAANEQGIYELEGATDDSEEIAAHITTGLLDFKSPHYKRVHRAYIGFRADGNLMLKTRTGEQVERWYEMKSPVEQGLHGARVRMSKGVRSRYWQFELHNQEGGDFELDEIEFVPIVLTRKLR